MNERLFFPIHQDEEMRDVRAGNAIPYARSMSEYIMQGQRIEREKQMQESKTRRECRLCCIVRIHQCASEFANDLLNA
jgi:hypothetical protein